MMAGPVSATLLPNSGLTDKGVRVAIPSRTVRAARQKDLVRSPAGPRRLNGKQTVAMKAASRVSGKQAGATNRSRTEKAEAKILFEKVFHSMGPRTYAAEVKELPNGNHVLVLTEGKRDKETGEVRQVRLFIYGEDFTAFFRLLHETAGFIRANPLSEEIRRKRVKFWAKKDKQSPRSGAR
jgi:hypothetical protein